MTPEPSPTDRVRATSPLEVYRATPMQRVELLQAGLGARDA